MPRTLYLERRPSELPSFNHLNWRGTFILLVLKQLQLPTDILIISSLLLGCGTTSQHAQWWLQNWYGHQTYNGHGHSLWSSFFDSFFTIFLVRIESSKPFVDTSTQLATNVYFANTVILVDQYGYNCEYSRNAFTVHRNTYFTTAKTTASRSFSATLFAFFSCELRSVFLQMPSNTVVGSLYTRLLRGLV